MAVTLKEVLSGKAAKPIVGQEYELVEDKVFKMKLPTYGIVNKFVELGWVPVTDQKGTPVRDEDGNLMFDDLRPFHQVVLERLQVIFDMNGVDVDDLIMPVAYKAHEDFLAFTRPIEMGLS
jgi:hypothetical protein